MSDSDRPSDATISRTLRDVVVAIHKTGKVEDLTVKRVRAKAESELGLSAGFLKTSQEWKQKSHDAILEAVDKYCGDEPTSDAEPKPKPKSKPPPKKAVQSKPPPKKAKTTSDKISGVKRKPTTPAKKPQKRRKTTVSTDDESDAIMSDPSTKEDTPSDIESEPPKKLVRRGKKVVTEDSDEEDHAPSPSPNKEKKEDKAESVRAVLAKERETPSIVDAKGDRSDSEMSSLIDESPAKKKQQKKPLPKKGGKEPKTKASTAAKPKGKPSKPKDEDSPDQAEIKRLQSWLVKCGIRKVWVKELANCETAKEKVKHLKEMLKDAGMDGKYSNEKAATIKEQREFAKDLEAIQEGARAWGEPGAEDSGRPRRRLNRGTQKAVPRYEEEEEESGGKSNDDEVKTKVEAVPKFNTEDNDEHDKAKPEVKKDNGVEQAEDDDDSDEDVEFDAQDDDSDDEVKFSSEGDDSAGDDSE
ncbi:hypothetical protein K505DRAFT_284577 [Melanomma pulvis-pyrius CBS 109.77]|uniref:Uncharacterized protein n=1 Tax=Melanomma pulvis-pyrius CBS 109.77 TaxID=1314802 RepID=A0A6A6WYN9_9PLEO|nr:hypothetical protein K505DRAFT_284577 [Melanomma pulvis-pyrius CBS 109.77]